MNRSVIEQLKPEELCFVALKFFYLLQFLNVLVLLFGLYCF